MPPAAGRESVVQLVAEGLQADRIQPDQAYVTESRGELLRIVELVDLAGLHGLADVDQHPHRNARLQLEHFEKQLFQAQERPPVDRAQIVAMMELAMIQKLLAGSGEARGIVSADQPGQRVLPLDGQPFQAFEKAGVKQRFRHVRKPRRPRSG